MINRTLIIISVLETIFGIILIYFGVKWSKEEK